MLADGVGGKGSDSADAVRSLLIENRLFDDGRRYALTSNRNKRLDPKRLVQDPIDVDPSEAQPRFGSQKRPVTKDYNGPLGAQ